MTVAVRLASNSDEAVWEAYVENHGSATFFHRFPWSRVLQRAFGHRAHYLIAEETGVTVGVLPLLEVRSRLFGPSLSSLPFCVYGGVLCDTEEADFALRREAIALADTLGVRSLELRNRAPSASGWPTKELYYTFRKALHGEHAENLKAIPNRQRAMLRKALGEGLFSEEVSDTRRIYRVYSESLRNLGTPVFGRRYLDILQEEFGEYCRVLMIRQAPDADLLYRKKDNAQLQHDPEPGAVSKFADAPDVAGVLSFYFRGEVLPYYGGSVTRARSIRGANHFIYWELMRRSVNEGVRGFDFGRSKDGTGAFAFKKNLGFSPDPLPYEYHLAPGARIPDVNPNNPKYRLLVKVWQRLPLPVANTLGPWIAGSLG